MLYHDILGGRVELRNPREHLSALFAGSLTTVSGLVVCLDADYLWWIKLLGWMVSCDLFADVKHADLCKESRFPSKASQSDHSSSLDHTTNPAQPNHPSDSVPLSSLFLNTLHDEFPALSLDCVPYRHLESYIRHLQAALAPGAFLVLGLTSRPANASFWSPSTILTAVPFFPRCFLNDRDQQHSAAQRTTTPLFTSILSVLQLLTTGPNMLTVEVARNISREYAHFLHGSVDRLENDPYTRAAFVRQWGMQAWVEERLCTAWEAGLLDAGLLEGWAIVVCKPE
ncbi:hypothetical protein DICSQDRAFT_177537 [Dichomitus squalens LYAD-421 SS1]|uniref:uncharacterized protein n=1 Tax=Dichomitus squalens (strain LYAD-421) TaxID=732165 RepID=UPI0004413655|nr:uncharacterized protein DICSQDRAFT_177537 [Dichomitus squalens LYAD-421 SS1]EJF66375.1 hypothetical protein DICSQDRAFT_177537 [Dichomitus squalens LYAD-421 SS1]